MRRALAPLVLLLGLALPAQAGASFAFLPGSAGFSAMPEEGGQLFTAAGAHPYALKAHLALTSSESAMQPGLFFPDGDLRELSLAFPPGLLANPNVVPQCRIADFRTPRDSPSSTSGESCPAATQVGTVDVTTPTATRRFGLFNLSPPPGSPAQLGIAPFGAQIAFDLQLRPRGDGAYSAVLESRNVTQSLSLTAIDFDIWGTPWGASHDGERGDCLNEANPSFPWAKCSVGAPLLNPPLAFLTMPTDCGAPLTFTASATAWQGGTTTASITPDSSGRPASATGCTFLRFEPTAFGQLTTQRASTASGYDFQLTAKADGLTDPAGRIGSPIRQARVSLPAGATLNPSVGAGLGVPVEPFTATIASAASAILSPNTSATTWPTVKPLSVAR